MKTGYSMLLGEYVQADGLVHRDCEHFQIVCPACREPVFKVEQEREGEGRHYLSHYRAERSHASDCELRVGRLSGGEIGRLNGLSRDQKLSLFLSVLQGAVIRAIWGAQKRSMVRKVVRRLQEGRQLAMLRDVSIENLRSIAPFDEFDLWAESYYDDVGEPPTTFAEAVQRRIARDMLLHLISPNARRSYDFLFNVSLLILESRLSAAEDAGSTNAQERRLHGYAVRLMRGRERDAAAAIGEAMHEIAQPPFVETPMPFLGKLGAEIHHELVGMLLRLPYFEILREKQAARS
ncbi:hypothetical protein SAMN06265365_11097 [Tistlia consotensis]|uniref:Uncharacterized protein n=1 Tax=Tistlia consotensis USBA 355 TaxID=560819 RepID=A0A1Y6BTC0_9PROT|nr:hypothetical protein [Tistlia consotensis]SMF27137.1 hypothetical protein SAMN05428998_10959 [Tistlia consotensis USBA 355]SNR66460.1 hypothetical protein SAMN06265365_11097 [Tistlia consotensis]